MQQRFKHVLPHSLGDAKLSARLCAGSRVPSCNTGTSSERLRLSSSACLKFHRACHEELPSRLFLTSKFASCGGRRCTKCISIIIVRSKLTKHIRTDVWEWDVSKLANVSRVSHHGHLIDFSMTSVISLSRLSRCSDAHVSVSETRHCATIATLQILQIYAENGAQNRVQCFTWAELNGLATFEFAR